MGQYISNGPCSCPYCGFRINEGRERTSPARNGGLLVECVWVCERCQMVARRDEKTLTAKEINQG